MRRRVEALVLLAIASACGNGPVRPAAYLRNGGIGPRAASCEDPALRIDADAVRALRAPAPSCGADASLLASDVGAAWAYVQTEAAAAPTGPIVSNPVELGLLALASTAGQRGLGGGGGERVLAGGGGEQALASGGGERALDGGGGERALSSAGGEHALAAGAGERALAAGSGERALAAGSGERLLASGAGERTPWSLRKSVSREAIGEGGEVEFGLAFVNDGAARVERLVIVDRVDPRLRVIAAPDARPFVLDDGSTLLVWDVRSPLGPREHRVSFRAVLDVRRMP